ncbi:MAG: WYL domain-containing protein, partial [Gemmatimonadales bacterium]
RRKVRLGYRKASEEATSTRVIRPYGIAFASGMWYVMGGDESGEGIRIFRLDRVEKVEVLEMRFELPGDFSVDAIVRDGRAFQAGEAATLRVRYSSRIARWIAEREGVEPAADGSLTVEHPLADTDWAVRHVLQYGPDAEVLAPAEVRAEIGRRLAKMEV